MKNRIKTLLKTTAAVATLFVGSQTWAATLVDQLTTTVSTNGSVSSAYAGAAAGSVPAIAAGSATDGMILTRIAIGEAANKAISLADTSLALQPVVHALHLSSLTGTNTISVTVPNAAPGDVVKIYDGALFTGARTLIVQAFAYGTNWTEADKIKYASKFATIEWNGPLEPTFSELAGVVFKYKKATVAEITKKLMP